MDISRMGAQAQITSLEELSGGPAGAAHVAEFERAMGGAGSLGGDLLSELGQIRSVSARPSRSCRWSCRRPATIPTA